MGGATWCHHHFGRVADYCSHYRHRSAAMANCKCSFRRAGAAARLHSLSQRSYVYDAAGNEIAVYELENIQPVSFGDIPEHVIQAFVAVEDNEFWVHHGVNARSFIRALLSNFASDAPRQGASTITMQVVKNDFMAGFERNGRYKLLQLTYAVRLEKERSKEEIMERYLNTVFFGNNSYGIAAAAETYFGKFVHELTFPESAFLAGLVRAPTSYDPINRPERSRAALPR